jgi:cytochrome P450
MSFSETLESTKVLISGGSETSTTALSGILYFLLKNPSTMAKLNEEIRMTFKSDADINMAGVQSLKYTLAVIYEGMRLFPPVPGSLRRVVTPGGRELAGNFVPGGTIVAVDLFSAGRYSKNFARSTEFCPERYLDDIEPEYKNDKQKSVRFFSVGPRDCVGKGLALSQIRIILARILFNFDLELEDPDLDWISAMPAFGFWQRSPLMLKLTPIVS